MASPDSAASPWVGRELTYWLETKTAAALRILPVLTDGELVWDDARGGFDPERSTALPAALAHAFTEEPRYVDLRWAHETEHLDLHHSEFREAIADLAAPLHGMSKSELEGEDIRRHHRALRLAIGAALGLLLLAVAATVSLVFALRYASNARTSERYAVIAQVREDRATRTARKISEQKQIAEKARDEADQQRALAQYRADEATYLRAAAEQNAAEANDQRARAEESSAEAERQRARAEQNWQIAQDSLALAQTELCSQNETCLGPALACVRTPTGEPYCYVVGGPHDPNGPLPQSP